MPKAGAHSTPHASKLASMCKHLGAHSMSLRGLEEAPQHRNRLWQTLLVLLSVLAASTGASVTVPVQGHPIADLLRKLDTYTA